jgi:hypothetical protein
LKRKYKGLDKKIQEVLQYEFYISVTNGLK